MIFSTASELTCKNVTRLASICHSELVFGYDVTCATNPEVLLESEVVITETSDTEAVDEARQLLIAFFSDNDLPTEPVKIVPSEMVKTFPTIFADIWCIPHITDAQELIGIYVLFYAEKRPIPFNSDLLRLLESWRCLHVSQRQTLNRKVNANTSKTLAVTPQEDSLARHALHPVITFTEDFKLQYMNDSARHWFDARTRVNWSHFDELLLYHVPDVAREIIQTVSKFAFLGHLKQQSWNQVTWKQLGEDTIVVDLVIYHQPDKKNNGQFVVLINRSHHYAETIDARNESRQRALANVMPIGILQFNENKHCIYSNEAWTRMVNIPAVRSYGEGWSASLPRDEINVIWNEVKRKGSPFYQAERDIQVQVGVIPKWLNVNMVGTFDTLNRFTGAVITVRDITEQKAQDKALTLSAQTDELTGVGNRAYFYERVNIALTRVKRHGDVALMFIDLDKFKYINDTFGHETGDLIISEVAHRLHAAVRTEDAVARLGGDEFAILFEGIVTPGVLSAIAAKIIHYVSSPVILEEHTLNISCSIGISTTTDKNASVQTLFHQADLALYQAKEKGRNQHRFYDHKLEKRHMMMSAIKESIADNSSHSLALVFQPQYNAKTEALIGFESLARWNHPAFLEQGPEDFIPCIEESGLISSFTLWTISASCRHISNWRANGLDLYPLHIAINLSAKQLNHARAASQILDVMEQFQCPASLFQIEVTETAFIGEDDCAVDNVRLLKDAGCSIALDDFGTGYASLSLLRRIPVDLIKIDRAFIKHVDHDKDNQAIVETILGLAKQLNISVIAEGVECIREQSWLIAHDCDLHQGYFYSPPVASEEVMGLFNHTQPEIIHRYQANE